MYSIVDRAINERCRGVSRMESLDVVLEHARESYSAEDKLAMATRKNDYYCALVQEITPAAILPGVQAMLHALRARGIKQAIGSSSRNTPLILARIGLHTWFDAVADGNDIQYSKPHPQVFLLAAERLHLHPSNCLVVEDAEAGVSAGLAGGFHVLAVGAARHDLRAHTRVGELTELTVEEMLGM